MNIENINKAIAVMERARDRLSLKMCDWQAPRDGEYDVNHVVKTEKELHACGNTACFAGHMAVSPEWLEDPLNEMTVNGMPVRTIDGDKFLADEALADWFEVSYDTTESFVYANDVEGYNPVYNKEWSDVDAGDVIYALQLLRDMGEEKFCEMKGL